MWPLSSAAYYTDGEKKYLAQESVTCKTTGIVGHCSRTPLSSEWIALLLAIIQASVAELTDPRCLLFCARVSCYRNSTFSRFNDDLVTGISTA